MYTLPNQLEFLSDEWLDEACKFLNRETAQRKERLGGHPFCASERFDNAPPHLKLPGNVACWSMLYDGEKVSVCRDFNETPTWWWKATTRRRSPRHNLSA